MNCKVKCKCGAVEGSAVLALPEGETKPTLEYSLHGVWYIRKGQPYCRVCGSYPCTVGEWNSE